jgi:hypothetical protein
MPLWEHQEMGCVWSYLMQKYEPISKNISYDLRNLMRNTGWHSFWQIDREDQRPPFNPEMECLVSLENFERYFSTLTAIGPWFLYRVLHSERLLQRNMVVAKGRDAYWEVIIGAECYISWDHRFPFIYPADRHGVLNFQRLWATLPPIEQPKLGWKRAWVLTNRAQRYLEEVLNYERYVEEDWASGYDLLDDERLKELYSYKPLACPIS